MVAHDTHDSHGYPLPETFLTMFVFFMLVIWIFLLFRVLLDVFRSPDLGGFAKAGWMLFVIALPFLGVFVYVIARGSSMGQRDLEQTQAQQQPVDSYVKDVAGSGSGTADELAKLSRLSDSGVINDDEFDRQTSKLLA